MVYWVCRLLLPVFFVSWNHCGCCFGKIQQQGAHTHADQRRDSLTFTPSACACRPGALRPCVLTPGVFAGCGLGAGVVRTCVFPEFCRLLDDRTLPRLPTLPLRSPPTHTITPDWFHHHDTFLSRCRHDFALPASGLRSTQMSSLVLLCCPRVGDP